MAELPTQIDKYEVLARLGKGGMAEVFLGRSTGEGGFERLVAVKRILPALVERPSFVEMFMDEARISAELRHSNIGQVYEFGRAGEAYFIAMEYIEGVHLKALYRHFGRVKQIPPPPMAAYLMANVCAALEHAHTRRDSQGRPRNIIHRDVSPSNVLVTFDGEVKLIDFGIARARQRVHETSVSSLKGKFAYMSPEQARGKELDPRSDIFGAGVLLFELLTRCNPFEDDSDLSTLERVRAAKVIPPTKVVGDVPPELERICLRALARRPAERYASAGAMQADLEAFSFKVGFGRSAMGQWMKQAFPDLIERTPALLRRAARRQAEAAQAAALEPDTPGSDVTEAPATSGSRAWILVLAGGLLLASALAAVAMLARSGPPPGVKLRQALVAAPSDAAPARDHAVQWPDLRRAPAAPDASARLPDAKKPGSKRPRRGVGRPGKVKRPRPPAAGSADPDEKEVTW